jgi:fumarate hydratase class II
VGAHVIGNDAAVAFGGSQGTLELNVFMPMMAHNLLESVRLLSNVSHVFAEKCVDGIEANVEQCRSYAESSPSIGTALNPYIGYEKAAAVIKRATKENKTIREVVLEEGLMEDDEITKALDIEAMTRGGIIK